MNKTKVVGVGIISIVIICFIVMLGLVIVELYLKPNKKTDIKLYETEYYGKHLDNTPYKDFTVQYIHPYYMFSLPWQKNDRVNTKNNIVSIDDNGFRKVKPAITTSHELQKVILLGGSTAFGHFASSDRGTIGSFLGELGSLDVINRSAPSWNSHQEAVALFKFDQLEKINASISFSLANDISIICLERDFNNNDEILDFPESWNLLKKLVNDIRGGIIPDSEKSFIRHTKDVAHKIFPNIYTELHNMKKSAKIINDRKFFGNCKGSDVAKVSNSFISNQYRMSKIAKSYGFTHFLVIQPQNILHNDTLVPGYGPSIEFKKNVIKHVLSSAYCSNNPCLDLSAVFDNKSFFLEQYDNISNDKVLVKKWMKSGVFVDNVHLNDRGNKVVAQEIVKSINSFQ